MFFGESTLLFSGNIDILKSEVNWRDVFKRKYEYSCDILIIKGFNGGHNS
jgi:hypothetical protein